MFESVAEEGEFGIDVASQWAMSLLLMGLVGDSAWVDDGDTTNDDVVNNKDRCDSSGK